jgi:hypothetical protein
VSRIVYEFIIRIEQPGWYVCRVLNAKQAELVEEAAIWQRGEYLRLLPSLRLVLLERLAAPNDWLALAFNPSDAHQRFRLDGPLIVHLVDGGQPFDRIIGRVEGAHIWYDDTDRRADIERSEQLRQAFAQRLVIPLISGLAPGERAAYRLLAQRHGITAQPPPVSAQSSVRSLARPSETLTVPTVPAEDAIEARTRQAVTQGGGQFVGYEVHGDEVLVRWERDGRHSTTRIDRSGGVISAGICLSGHDRAFDLTSIVGVVAVAPGYARGYGEDDWDDEE